MGDGPDKALPLDDKVKAAAKNATSSMKVASAPADPLKDIDVTANDILKNPRLLAQYLHINDPMGKDVPPLYTLHSMDQSNIVKPVLDSPLYDRVSETYLKLDPTHGNGYTLQNRYFDDNTRDDVSFTTGKSGFADITDPAKYQQMKEDLEKHGGNATLYGYASNSGPDALNKKLSADRVKTIYEHLKADMAADYAKQGLPATLVNRFKITTSSLGTVGQTGDDEKNRGVTLTASGKLYHNLIITPETANLASQFVTPGGAPGISWYTTDAGVELGSQLTLQHLEKYNTISVDQYNYLNMDGPAMYAARARNKPFEISLQANNPNSLNIVIDGSDPQLIGKFSVQIAKGKDGRSDDSKAVVIHDGNVVAVLDNVDANGTPQPFKDIPVVSIKADKGNNPPIPIVNRQDVAVYVYGPLAQQMNQAVDPAKKTLGQANDVASDPYHNTSKKPVDPRLDRSIIP